MKPWERIAIISNAGRLPGLTQRELDDLLRGLPGKRIKLSVLLQEKPRTLKQNKFYQGPFIEAFQRCLLDCGQRVEHDDIHDGLRDAYAKNGYSIHLPKQQSLWVPPSTRRLSTTGFEDYLEEIRAHFAGEFDWQLPLVNEVPIEAYE